MEKSVFNHFDSNNFDIKFSSIACRAHKINVKIIVVKIINKKQLNHAKAQRRK